MFCWKPVVIHRVARRKKTLVIKYLMNCLRVKTVHSNLKAVSLDFLDGFKKPAFISLIWYENCHKLTYIKYNHAKGLTPKCFCCWRKKAFRSKIDFKRKIGWHFESMVTLLLNAAVSFLFNWMTFSEKQLFFFKGRKNFLVALVSKMLI